ncbi:MAG: hypothetical protein PHU23_15785 [Dehalococcoidales bacterium]|nr:hypothetical protein [Dehalococcoidales bacterium]
MKKIGDLVEFKRRGPTSFILGGLLKILDHEWDGWGWHLAIAYGRTEGGWYILESLAGGPEINFYPDMYLAANTRSYSWLDAEPIPGQMASFRLKVYGKKYDVAVYFWTALQYLVRHYFNRRIPRLLDDRYTCWELVFEFCEEMGKPIGSKYDCPTIVEFQKAVGNKQ